MLQDAVVMASSLAMWWRWSAVLKGLDMVGSLSWRKQTLPFRDAPAQLLR